MPTPWETLGYRVSDDYAFDLAEKVKDKGLESLATWEVAEFLIHRMVCCKENYVDPQQMRVLITLMMDQMKECE